MPRPKLLYVSHRFPYPPDRGEKIRSYYVIRHLARTFDVSVGAIVDNPADFDHVPALRRICADVAGFGIDKRLQKLRALARVRRGRPLMLDYYHHAGLMDWVGRTLDGTRFDVIFTLCTAMAPYTLHRRGPAKILDMTDVDSEKWAEYSRRSGWPMRAVWAREARTLLAYEREAAMASDITLMVTRAEADRFVELAPEVKDRIDWVENGVDLDSFAPSRDLPNPFLGGDANIVLVGNMDYWPNSDAACWFAQHVVPLVRAEVPTAAFWVIGSNPGDEVRRLADTPGIHVTGRVAAVQPYIAHADVSVSPLRVARGIQNKVLEAMAMGRPVVASPQAFEGVRAQPGRDLLVAEGADATARAVLEVLAGHHPGLGAAARRTMERDYSWDATLARLDAHIAGLRIP